jgi:hypothetical protein
LIYLVIMLLVAGTGLAGLWVRQRRERAHLETVDGFQSSLERLSETPPIRPRRRAATGREAAAPARRGAPVRRPSARRTPMDPARRAAAKKRIEARRRAAARRRSL